MAISLRLWCSDRRLQGFKMHPTGYIFGHQLAI